MRKIALLAGLSVAAWFVAYAPEASAVTCVKGAYRAGCAGPNGAVVGRHYGRGVAVRGYRRPATVVHRGTAIRRY